MATFTISENFGTYQGNTSYILDGNTTNCWRADAQQGNGKYVLATASEEIHVDTVVYSTTQSSEVFKSGASLQVSSDGSSYTTIGQFNGSASQTFTVNKDCQYIRIYCTSGNNYVSISELAINYSAISKTMYTIDVQAGSGVTVDKVGKHSILENTSFEMMITGKVSTFTDNGVDAKSKLESHIPQSGDTVTKYPASYSTSGTSISGTRYRNCIGKGSSTTATGNDYANGNSGATSIITYTFDFSDIPEDAIIDSVSVKVGGHLENTSRSTANLQLYSGNTAKGTQTKFTTTNKQVITMTPGTWTRAELQNAQLRFTIGYYGGLVNGVDFVVSYSMPGGNEEYFTYVIDPVKGNHTILVNISATPSTRIRIKVDGTSKKVLKILKLDGGKVVEVKDSDLDTSIKYRII